MVWVSFRLQQSYEMAFKIVVLCATLAYANAGYLGGTIAAAPALAYSAAPAVSSTFYGAPAAYAAPSVAYGAPAAYAAPSVAYAAPALATSAITSQHSNTYRSFGNLGQISTYSKTIDTPFSSVRKADVRVSNPGLRIAAAAPALAYSAAPALAYSAAPAISTYHGAALAAPAISAYHAAPALSAYHAAPLVQSAAYAAPAVGLGVTYSAAPAVSHIHYASAYNNYGW